MFERNDKPDERAQVGIGTLIVFIAMVLVAAIAAGVLINTAGFLQTSAEESGQQAGDQVTNRLQVVSTIGANITENGVGTVEVTVKQAPGAGNIDIGETLAQWVDSSGSYDLTEGNGLEVTSVQDPNDNSISESSVLNDPGDRAKLNFDVTNASNRGTELAEGSTATITLNTQSGGTTTVAISVPETLSDSTAVNL